MARKSELFMLELYLLLQGREVRFLFISKTLPWLNKRKKAIVSMKLHDNFVSHFSLWSWRVEVKSQCGWGKAFKMHCGFKCELPLWLRVNIAMKSLRSCLIETWTGGNAPQRPLHKHYFPLQLFPDFLFPKGLQGPAETTGGGNNIFQGWRTFERRLLWKKLSKEVKRGRSVCVLECLEQTIWKFMLLTITRHKNSDSEYTVTVPLVFHQSVNLIWSFWPGVF